MQKIRIDFDNPGLPQHISAVKNDSQSRFFQATLYENGKAYTAPAGASYSIMYRGFGPQNQGWYDTINDGAGKRAACAVSGNVVTCEIARQALQVPGHVSIVLCVTTGKGYMLKSWPIECDCKNDRYDSTVEVQSFFYITQVTNADWNQVIQAWEDLKNTIDPTLSLSGKAADAAKVGEAVNAEATRAKAEEEKNAKGVSQLKEDLGGVGEIIGIETTHSGKFIEIEPSEPILEDTCWSTQGNSVSSKASGTMTAGKFPVIPGDKIKLYGLYNGTTVYPLGIFVDQNNVIISQVGNTDNEATIYGYEQHTLARKEALEAIVPDSAKYVLVNGRNKTSGTLIVCPSKVERYVNGSEQTKVKEIQFSPLYKKKIGFAGDSICYGNGYIGGYAKIIGENNGMTIQNLGIGSTYLEMEVAGSTVITSVNGQRTTWTTLTKGTFDPSLVNFSLSDDYGHIRYAKREWTSKHQYEYTEITQSEWNGADSLYIFRRSIPERVQYFDSDCDYIIMEGGINDVLGGLYLGEVTEGFASELDTHTVLGGAEQMCRNLLERFAGKKLGFILIHKVLQLPFTSPPNADGTQKLYFDKIKEVLNKYSIPVLDLYNESGLNTGMDSFLKYTLATSANSNGDGVHPNEEGYRKFYVPKIEAWLKSL